MAFWKPGTIAPGSAVDRDTENETVDTVLAHADKQYRHLTMIQQRERLPVFKLRKEILYLLEKFQTVIVVGQTGCGKTTQIPQYLMESNWTNGGKQIACTQPRRIAATSVAQRVADEMNCSLGEEVGYLIRFDDRTSDRTKIKYMTDGMLFREATIDPLLTKYSVIMIDEAHERSLYTDILIGVIKKIQKKRPDLRVIISSATMDAEHFHGFFNTNATNDKSNDTSTIISLEGRMYPVDILYTDVPVSNYVEKTIQTVFDIHTKEPKGDILVFLTGREEIDTVVGEIYERGKT
ncbi:P-loop containing nucleoside triphosphate hydrolase protein [Sporodiniella umbellata]|nr:P-loop containing nucleoside triphosphate hydrolase protein [Sporodiniella umbellata]